MASVTLFGYVALCVFVALSLVLHRRQQRKHVSLPTEVAEEKKKNTKDTDFRHVFPPSQRTTLRDIAGWEDTTEVDLISKPLLGMRTDFRTADESTYVFSGFKVGEVKALGDFPDYATLSGVPLPTAAKFDVNHAAPRPYRPFRWNYHITMGL